MSNLNHKKGDFPITEELTDTSLSLSLYLDYRMKQLNYIAPKVNSGDKDMRLVIIGRTFKTFPYSF